MENFGGARASFTVCSTIEYPQQIIHMGSSFHSSRFSEGT